MVEFVKMLMKGNKSDINVKDMNVKLVV